MQPLTKQTKAYLMVLVITLAGAIACWFLLGQIEKLQDDSEAVANLPFRHNVDIKAEEDFVNKTITLKVGQVSQITTGGLSLKLLSVSDSRCPAQPKLQCIWAGTIKAKVELLQTKTSLGFKEVEVNTSVNINKYSIALKEVLPKEKKLETKLSDYLLTFKISYQGQ